MRTLAQSPPRSVPPPELAPSRSRLAISEPCNVVGIAKGGRRRSARNRSASSRISPLSKTELVNSSTKQRHPIRALDDLLAHLLGQGLAAGEPRDHLASLSPAKPFERQRRHMLASHPFALNSGRKVTSSEHRQPQGSARAQTQADRAKRGRSNARLPIRSAPGRTGTGPRAAVPRAVAGAPSSFAATAPVESVSPSLRQGQKLGDKSEIFWFRFPGLVSPATSPSRVSRAIVLAFEGLMRARVAG